MPLVSVQRAESWVAWCSPTGVKEASSQVEVESPGSLAQWRWWGG
jgi:hypothetical protein